MRMNPLDWVAYALVVIGGLNWGLVGLFQFDLVAELFGGQDSALARLIYTLVGLAALYLLTFVPRFTEAKNVHAVE